MRSIAWPVFRGEGSQFRLDPTGKADTRFNKQGDFMKYPISCQLYSARNFWPIEPQLGALKSMGYDAVEPWQAAYEDDPVTFGRQIRDAGLDCYGFHMPLAGLINETAKYIDIAHALGAWLMIPPYLAPNERGTTPDMWRILGDRLGQAAQQVSAHGLKVAWHNHDFEYFPLTDGSRPIDHILAAGGKDLHFEIDCGWIMRAGTDPAAELIRYADRIIAIQVKDTASDGTLKDDGWTATGDGIIDWPRLAPLFSETNAHHIVTEHDNPSDWKVFASRSLDYLRSLPQLRK